MMTNRNFLQVLIGFMAGAVAFATLHWTATKTALPFHISEVMAALLGRPESPYGSWNLVVPRLLVLLITAAPAGLLGLLCYRMLIAGKNQFSVWTVCIATALVAVFFAFASGGTSAVVEPMRAALLIVCLFALTAASAYYVLR